EEPPAEQVDTPSVFAPEFLGTFHVCYLLEQFISRREVGKLKIRKCNSLTHFVDVIDGSLRWAADFIDAFRGTKQHIAVSHQAQVYPTLQSIGDRAVDI